MGLLYRFIVYSGIIAFILLSVNIILGVMELNFVLHRWVGIFTFIFAVIHVGLIVYRNSLLRHKRKVAAGITQGGV